MTAPAQARLRARSLADLHLHTTASDGRLTPRQLIDLAALKGLQVVAVTDHDTTDGLEEAFQTASLYPDLTLIPGIELGTDIPGSEIHVLGYWLDVKNLAFQETLARFREGREHRAQGMVRKLAALGFPLEWERVAQLAQGAIGRPHIAQAMVEKGYVASTQDAFTAYLGRNGPAYVERAKLTPAEAIRMILDVGGVPVLAHPREIGDWRKVLPELVAAGLRGMEVYYKLYPPGLVEELKERARALGLMALGGTDYHAIGNPDEVEPGTSGPPLEEVQKLLALAPAALRQAQGERG